MPVGRIFRDFVIRRLRYIVILHDSEKGNRGSNFAATSIALQVQRAVSTVNFGMYAYIAGRGRIARPFLMHAFVLKHLRPRGLSCSMHVLSAISPFQALLRATSCTSHTIIQWFHSWLKYLDISMQHQTIAAITLVEYIRVYRYNGSPWSLHR